MIKIHILLLIVGLGLFSLEGSGIAQVGRVGGFPGSVAGRSSLGGAQRLSPRSVNPNFNPRGSISTFQNLNPRGSLSPALNLNPQGSLLRPRIGEPAGSARGGVATSARETAYKIPFAPNYSQLRILPRSSISSWTKIGLQQFESSLSKYKNADAWRTYLNLEKIVSRLETAAEQPLDESSREQLADMLERFATVATDTKYKKVKLLPGFRATWTSLRELLRADSGDERERLIRSAIALNRELKDQKGGTALQEYLALPELIEADAASEPDSKAAFRAVCEKTNASFENILANGGDYRRIADMTEFQATAENLKKHLQKIQEPQPSPSLGERIQEPQPSPSLGERIQEPQPSRSLGVRILESVVELDRELGKVAPGSEWAKRLSLDDLRGAVRVSRDQPGSDSERKSLEDILAAYQAVAKNDEDAVVNKLPEFKETLEALQEYLKPSDVQPPKD